MRAAALAMALLAQSPGCSWAFLQGPPDLPFAPDEPVTCTQSATVPILDAAGSGASGVLGVLLVVAAFSLTLDADCPPASSECITPTERTELAVAGASMVAVGALLAGSAVHGFAQTSRCREVAGWQAGCLSGFEDDCWRLYGPRAKGPLPPPPALPAPPGGVLPSNGAPPGPAPEPAPPRTAP